MNQLPFDITLSTLRGLPVKDILATCSVDTKLHQLCQRPDFWSRLIRLSFNQEGSTAQDYDFFYQFVPLVNFNDPVQKKLFNSEYDAYLDQEPIRYFIFNPVLTKHKYPIYKARTVAGLILKHNSFDSDWLRDKLKSIIDDIKFNGDEEEDLDEIYERVIRQADPEELGEKDRLNHCEFFELRSIKIY